MRTSLYFLSCFLIFGYGKLFAQDLKLQKGNVTSDILISDTLPQTFSIYIPTTFKADTLSKMLIVLDPKGRGTQASRLFMAGTIDNDFVIASNDFPLTDSLGQNKDLVLQMMKKALTIVRTDQAHLYVAGLEEGALTAASLPYLVQGISGLLLINDIFVNKGIGSRRFRTMTIGLVGDASPNYYKMQHAFRRLAVIDGSNHLLTYAGEGGWPSTEYLGTMLHDMYINNLDRRKIPLPDVGATAYLDYDLNTVETLIRRQEYLVAHDLLDQFKHTYRGKQKLKPIRRRLQDLRREKGFKMQVRTVFKNAQEEETLFLDLDYFLAEDISNSNFENLGFWDEKIRSFEKAAIDPQKPTEQLIAKRMMGFLKNSVEDYEEIFASSRPTTNQLIFLNVFKTVLDPKDYKSYMEVIGLAAKDNDDNTAYFYLEELLKNDFKDYDALFKIPNTQLLRTSSVFNDIVKKYLGRSRF